MNKKLARNRRQKRDKAIAQNYKTQIKHREFSKFCENINIKYFSDEMFEIKAKNPVDAVCLFCNEKISFQEFRDKQFVGFVSLAVYYFHKRHFYHANGKPHIDQAERLQAATDLIFADRLKNEFGSDHYLDSFLLKYFPNGKKTGKTGV